MNSKVLVACVALACILAACGDSTPTEPQPISELPRALSAAETELIAASNSFAFDLFREVAAADAGQNIFISPLSASMALGMTMNGARGGTFDAMSATLGFGGLSQHEINASYRSLIGLLRGLDPKVEMLIGNSIWYRAGFPFHQAFFDTTRTYFDAEVAGLDFDDPAAVTTINRWVDRSTRGKISEIVDRIDSDVVMYLINAVYFKGDWTQRFDKSATQEAPFHDSAGTVQTGSVMMMYRTGAVGYARGTNYGAVDLAYGGGAFSMTVILPDRGVPASQVIAELNPGAWQALVSRLDTTTVDVYLPKLRLEYKKLLNDQLRLLGMVPAFDPSVSDFTGMSPLGKRLYISNVLQKTFVAVDEIGTEAAAATSVEVRFICACDPEFRADRPFIFAIRERLTGTILFIGRIEVPPPSA